MQIEEKFARIRSMIQHRNYARHVVPRFYAVENNLAAEDEQVSVWCGNPLCDELFGDNMETCLHLKSFLDSEVLLSSDWTAASWHWGGGQSWVLHGRTDPHQMGAVWTECGTACRGFHILLLHRTGGNGRPGAHPTRASHWVKRYVDWIRNSIKISSTLVQSILNWSSQHFAYVMIALLLWCVQNFIVMSWISYEQKYYKIALNFMRPKCRSDARNSHIGCCPSNFGFKNVISKSVRFIIGTLPLKMHWNIP